MEFDLQRGLHDLSWAPSVAPDAVPTDRMLTRVHRGRALRATAIGAASLALVAGAAVAVVALPRNPIPPVITPTPTTTPTPTPSPTPTPTPTPDPQTDERPITALMSSGTLVQLDPRTGETLRTVVDGLTTTDVAKTALTVAPDGDTAYVSLVAAQGAGRPGREIVKVSLDDGTWEVIAEGTQPAISPDGTTLAYVGTDPARPESEEFGLNLLDLATGTSRYIPSGLDSSIGWMDQLAWSRDATRLYVPRGTEGSELQAVAATATGFDDAVDLGDAVGEQEPVVLDDGSVLVVCGSSWDEAAAAEMYVAVIDPLSGSVTARVEPLSGRYIEDMAARPTARSVVFLSGASTFPSPEQPAWDLYRWDDGADPRLLGTGFIAVAW